MLDGGWPATTSSSQCTRLACSTMQPAIWTVGHSTRTTDEFLSVLSAYRIELVADVRRYPGSRRLPQFGSADLERALEMHGIQYKWLPSLGGRRTARPDSDNTGWRHPAFRGYADHLESEEFAEGLFELLMLAGGMRTAVMCAEVLWWRCHRRLIADVVTSLGGEVVHIRNEATAETHILSSPARLVDGALSYEDDAQLALTLAGS
jgi:uncharacterized protein (DUF488 family)